MKHKTEITNADFVIFKVCKKINKIFFLKREKKIWLSKI